VATNPTPCHLDYSFSEPGGVKIRADGALSMGRWAVKDSREIDVKYHAFGGDHAPKEPGEAATVLFVTGSKDKPLVTLNGTDVTGTLKAWKQNDENGWLVPLTGTMPTDAELTARLGRAGTRRK
jgi:hypothetical protein